MSFHGADSLQAFPLRPLLHLFLCAFAFPALNADSANGTHQIDGITCAAETTGPVGPPSAGEPPAGSRLTATLPSARSCTLAGSARCAAPLRGSRPSDVTPPSSPTHQSS